ncbi:MAG: ATP-binding cassette domain-containing protein, partial [Clostridium sp.]
MNDDVIKVSDLEVKYNKNIILKNINLEIKKGETVGFLGPSGCGKTTLVKSIIGMNSPSKGYVEVIGEQMPSLKVVSEFGYMAQSDALYDDLSALDNLLFFCALYGVKKKDAEIKAKELFKLV